MEEKNSRRSQPAQPNDRPTDRSTSQPSAQPFRRQSYGTAQYGWWNGELSPEKKTLTERSFSGHEEKKESSKPLPKRPYVVV